MASRSGWEAKKLHTQSGFGGPDSNDPSRSRDLAINLDKLSVHKKSGVHVHPQPPFQGKKQ